ncbi:ABC transporter substrate-binding protein [Geochorda subterranea]|uniref:ABC transporter substrate-binding protein n=1 Tax=Geochorda subterranea TaxID=3109564 RepID=A0ABZ1BLP8_9FIRM|nr:ABC transporter substrate-binding protein [Limnochorda sp. LNt]WRP13750.1 ABC transporter substrate-binding protein [Limnochorda sp. LNt]
MAVTDAGEKQPQRAAARPSRAARRAAWPAEWRHAFALSLLPFLLSVGLLSIGLVALAPGSASAADVVTLGTLKLIGGAPIFVGLDKGFFAEEGLDVQVRWFSAASPIAVAVAANQLDVGATGITAALFNSIAQGARLILVADRGSERPGYRLNALLTSRERYEAGLRSVQDLRGARIGITELGSTYHYQIGRILELNGMSVGDVELVPLRDISMMLQAVRQGTVDAALVSPPWGANAEAEGWGRVVFWAGDLLPYQVTGVFFSQRMAARRDVAVRFMRAYIRGVRWYNQAAFGLGGPGGPGTAMHDELLRIVADYTGARPDAIALSLAYVDPEARVDVADLRQQQEWYQAHGLLARVVDPAQFVDMSFIDEALAGLAAR